jgi:release factor glutamine methyltransferase
MQIQKNPIESQWTIGKILQWTTSYFKSNHIDSPRLTAEILLAQALGLNRIDLYTWFDQPLNPDELSALKSLIKRRINREPVAYITGKKEFFGLEFEVSSDVLIPRPETEFLVEEGLRHIPQETSPTPMNIIDMGTGSGAIIVSLAVNRPEHHYFASDVSFSAIQTAKTNAKKFGFDNIRFFAGDWFSPLRPFPPIFDVIVSNPPYIPVDEIKNLAPEINRYEPRTALESGIEGMNAIDNLIRAAPGYLREGGLMLLEIGHDQRERVEKPILHSRQFHLLKFVKDYGGHDRVAVMQKMG